MLPLPIFALLLMTANAHQSQPKAHSLKLEFLMFDGCPNSPKMLVNLRTALKALHINQSPKVLDITKLSAKDRRRGFGAPTVLVNTKELFGRVAPTGSETSVSCRLYSSGVPTAGEIERQLSKIIHVRSK